MQVHHRHVMEQPQWQTATMSSDTQVTDACASQRIVTLSPAIAQFNCSITKVPKMADDFSKGKRGPVIQADPNKTRITIRLDQDIIDHLKAKVNAAGGGNYQSLINNALREYLEIDSKSLEKRLRKIIREELKKAG